MKNILIIFLLLQYSIVSADEAKSKKNIYPYNYGILSDSSYYNPYFGLRLYFPLSWIVQNKTQIENIFEKGKKVIEYNDEISNKYIQELDINSMTLIMLSKFEIGSPVISNPTFILLSENMAGFPGVKVGSDYQFHLANGLKQSNLKMDCINTSDSLQTNKYCFHDLVCSSELTPNKIEYLTTIINHFAVSFIISYKEENDKLELLNIIKSIQFTESE